MLQTVLDHTFTGPDQTLNRLSDPDNIDMPDKQDNTSKVISPANPELAAHLEDMYQVHFTEEMYDNYVGRYVFTYQVNEHDDMNLSHMTIKPGDSSEAIYDFTFDVAYQKEDSETQHFKLKGQANITEEGKIKRFNLQSDEGLAQAVSQH